MEISEITESIDLANRFIKAAQKAVVDLMTDEFANVVGTENTADTKEISRLLSRSLVRLRKEPRDRVGKPRNEDKKGRGFYT